MGLLTTTLGLRWSNGGTDLEQALPFATSGVDKRNVLIDNGGVVTVPLRFPLAALQYFWALSDQSVTVNANASDKGVFSLLPGVPFFWYRGGGQPLSAVDGFGDLDGADDHQTLRLVNSEEGDANVLVRVGFLASLVALPCTFSAFADDNTGAVGTVAWGSPSSALTSDNAYATAALNSTNSHYLKGTAPIDGSLTMHSAYAPSGLKVTLEAKSGGADTVAVYPVLGGVIQSGYPLTKVSGTLGGSDSDLVYGGPWDFGGLAPTVAQVNAAGLGVAVKVAGAAGAHTVSVDCLRALTLYGAY